MPRICDATATAVDNKYITDAVTVMERKLNPSRHICRMRDDHLVNIVLFGGQMVNQWEEDPQTPPYITSQFTRVADMPNRRRLQSASSNQLDVPSIRLSTVGSRAFLVAGAKVWNSLPDDVTSAPTLSTFPRHLKTYLFCCCYNTVWHRSYLFRL